MTIVEPRESDDTRKATAPDPPRRRPARIGLILGLLAAFTVAYLVILFVFIRGDVHQNQVFTSDSGGPPDRIRINVTLLSVDANNNAYRIRLDPVPQGGFRAADGTPAIPLRISVDEIGGDRTNELPAGQWIPDREATLSARGDTSLYPFDAHHIPLEIAVADQHNRLLPITVGLSASMHDWDVDATQLADSAGDIHLDMTATRAAPVVTFALGLMVVLVLLVVVTVGMVTRAVGMRKVGFPTLASLAALLFAIPGIRNSMPDTPPVGTLSDFIVFFWALLIVAVCMAVASQAWLREAKRTAEDPPAG